MNIKENYPPGLLSAISSLLFGLIAYINFLITSYVKLLNRRSFAVVSIARLLARNIHSEEKGIKC